MKNGGIKNVSHDDKWSVLGETRIECLCPPYSEDREYFIWVCGCPAPFSSRILFRIFRLNHFEGCHLSRLSHCSLEMASGSIGTYTTTCISKFNQSPRKTINFNRGESWLVMIYGELNDIIIQIGHEMKFFCRGCLIWRSSSRRKGYRFLSRRNDDALEFFFSPRQSSIRRRNSPFKRIPGNKNFEIA